MPPRHRKGTSVLRRGSTTIHREGEGAEAGFERWIQILQAGQREASLARSAEEEAGGGGCNGMGTPRGEGTPRGGRMPSPRGHLPSSAARTGLSHAVHLARGPRGRVQAGL